MWRTMLTCLRSCRFRGSASWIGTIPFTKQPVDSFSLLGTSGSTRGKRERVLVGLTLVRLKDLPRWFGSSLMRFAAGPNMIWPMSISMRGLTSDDDDEISSCLRILKSTTAGTGEFPSLLLPSLPSKLHSLRKPSNDQVSCTNLSTKTIPTTTREAGLLGRIHCLGNSCSTSSTREEDTSSLQMGKSS